MIVKSFYIFFYVEGLQKNIVIIVFIIVVWLLIGTISGGKWFGKTYSNWWENFCVGKNEYFKFTVGKKWDNWKFFGEWYRLCGWYLWGEGNWIYVASRFWIINFSFFCVAFRPLEILSYRVLSSLVWSLELNYYHDLISKKIFI